MRLIVLAVLALFLPIAQSAAAEAPDGLAWRDVLRGIKVDLDRRAAEVEAIALVLPEVEAEADLALANADKLLTQTLLLHGIAGEDPWTLRTLLARYDGVRMQLHKAFRRLVLAKDHLARIKEENAALREIRKRGLADALQSDSGAALADVAERLTPIKARVEHLRERVYATLARYEALEATVIASREDLRGDYIGVFKAYFFSRTHAALDDYGLILLQGATLEWLEDFPRFATSVLSDTRWGPLAMAGLLGGSALMLLGRMLARRLSLTRDRIAAVGWASVSAGLALYVGSMSIPLTASHIVNHVIVGMVFGGATVLLYRPRPAACLPFFFLVYALGAFTQMCNFPAELVCVYWALCMAGVGWVRWRAGRRSEAARLWLLGVASLAGFGPMSVAVAQAWFLLRLATACMRGLRVLLDRVGGIWTGYVHPLAVTLLAVLYLGWMLLFMGGPGFVDYVFTLELDMGPVRLTLDGLAAMTLLFFTVRLMLAWLGAYLEKGSFGGHPLEPALAHTLGTLCSYTLWLSYFLVALHLLGLPLTGLTWIASGLSVGVGFGLKDIINNFVSGLIILFGGSIKKGDVVQTGKVLGEVTNVSVRNTTVRTLDNSMVIIPNSSFLRGEIINWSFQDKRIRLTIPVSVVPGTKVKKVRKLLLAEAKANPLVLADPAPSVVLRQFGKLGLDFELYVWIEDFRSKFDVESELAASIDQALQDNKVTVAFQGAKVKYKARGSEEAQREAARQALREKRHQVFTQVKPLTRVHMRQRWGMPAGRPPGKEDD